MATLPFTSRYSNSNIILDDNLLRSRLTEYLTDPKPIDFIDRDDNIRYQVQIKDRLDNISTHFYGDPKLWWVIAAFQQIPIMNPLVLEPGRILIIPSFSYISSEILKAPL